MSTTKKHGFRYCETCGTRLVKNGKEHGKQRWRCLHCGTARVRPRQDVADLNRRKTYTKHLLSKSTAHEVAQRKGISREAEQQPQTPFIVVVTQRALTAAWSLLHGVIPTTCTGAMHHTRAATYGCVSSWPRYSVPWHGCSSSVVCAHHGKPVVSGIPCTLHTVPEILRRIVPCRPMFSPWAAGRPVPAGPDRQQ